MNRAHIIKIASHIAVKTGLLTCLDRLNRQRGGIILVFHDICASALKRQLTQIAESYRFITLTEMVTRLSQNRPTAGLCAITFDDGLKDVIEAAAALAERHKWPMTFFLPTRSLDEQQGFWFQELDSLLERAAGKTLMLDDKRYELTDRVTIKQVSDMLDARFKNHTTEDQSDELLRTIRLSLFGATSKPAGVPVPAPASWSRVRELASRSELSFESHSITHRATSRLQSAVLVKELVESKKRIEEITGRDVQHFCYPYGGIKDIGTEAANLVRKFFSSGTTMVRGRCSHGQDPALLPRLPLYENDSEEVVALKIGSAR